MPNQISGKAEDYALQMVLSGAESVIEDDLNEDGELDDEQHTRSCEFGYALLKAHPGQPGGPYLARAGSLQQRVLIARIHAQKGAA